MPSVGANDTVILVRLKGRADRSRLAALAGGDPREETYKGRKLLVGGNESVAVLDERTYAVGQLDPLHGVLDTAPGTDGPLAAARQLMAGNHAFVASVNLPAMRDLSGDRLPAEAEPLKPMLDAKSAVLVADLGAEARARLVFADADAARKGEKAFKAGLDMARAGLAEARKEVAKEAGRLKLLEAVDAALKDAALTRQGDALRAVARLQIEPDTIAPVVVEYFAQQMGRASRVQGVNNLKQIVLAMHNFHDAYGHFPPAAVYDKAGKPLLSWRVQLLPFLAEDELYKQFRLDEPWDSDHNKKLLDKMPRVYAPSGRDQKNKGHLTPYLVFVGKGTVFEGKKGIRIADITDGTSNTFMVVETLPLVPWTKPDDLPFDADKPLPKLGGLHEGGFYAGLADGSVRFVRSKVAQKTLKIAIGRNDGQVLPEDF
jgi:hypothetical protein